MNQRVACLSTKSCSASTDLCVLALLMPRDRGKLQDQLVEVPKIEQRTFEQLQVLGVLAVGEVKLAPQKQVQQRISLRSEVLSGWANRVKLPITSSQDKISQRTVVQNLNDWVCMSRPHDSL